MWYIERQTLPSSKTRKRRSKKQKKKKKTPWYGVVPQSRYMYPKKSPSSSPGLWLPITLPKKREKKKRRETLARMKQKKLKNRRKYYNKGGIGIGINLSTPLRSPTTQNALTSAPKPPSSTKHPPSASAASPCPQPHSARAASAPGSSRARPHGQTDGP